MKTKTIPGENCLRIKKGNNIIDIYPATNKFPKLPVRIKYEDTIYPLSYSTTELEVIESFKRCYSEEQFLETLINYTTK